MVGGFGGLEIVGTADEIADTMQSWLETGAADGFNIMFPTVPAGLDDFVELVILNCGAVASSVRTTTGRRCVNISVCRGRRTNSFRAGDRRGSKSRGRVSKYSAPAEHHAEVVRWHRNSFGRREAMLAREHGDVVEIAYAPGRVPRPQFGIELRVAGGGSARHPH